MNINPDLVGGIDCGTGGGIAYYKDKRHVAVKMPKTVTELKDYLLHIKSICRCPLFFVERQQAWHSDFSKAGKAFRSRKLLDNYERIKTTLELLDMPFIEVAPITWQTRLKIHVKGEDYAVRKQRYWNIAQAQCQTLKVAKPVSDALLIVQFGRLILNYEMDWIETRLSPAHKIIIENNSI